MSEQIKKWAQHGLLKLDAYASYEGPGEIRLSTDEAGWIFDYVKQLERQIQDGARDHLEAYDAPAGILRQGRREGLEQAALLVENNDQDGNEGVSDTQECQLGDATILKINLASQIRALKEQ